MHRYGNAVKLLDCDSPLTRTRPQIKTHGSHRHGYDLSYLSELTTNQLPPQNNNFTFDTDMGGFSDANIFCIDQCGFKTIIQAEAAEFLQPSQLLLNTIVMELQSRS